MRVGWLVMLVGCNPLLGLDETKIAPDGGAGGSCGALPFDRRRYAFFAGSDGYAWATARDSACSSYAGMDLAVVNEGDATEISQVFNLTTPPYWLGVSFDGTAWTSIDGCTPSLAWAPGEPATERIGDCALRKSDGLASVSCTATTFGNAEPIKAVCETPRPSASCIAQQTGSTYMRMSTVNVAYSNARATCTAAGMHLVEINTSAELDTLKQMFPGITFWIGATRTSLGFASVTGCPQVFAWKVSEPTLNAGDCVVYDGTGMLVGDCTGNLLFAEVICEDSP